MPTAFDPAAPLTGVDETGVAARGLMFRRRTVWIVHIFMIACVVALSLWAGSLRTALLTPVDPTFHALMIGVGVFLGVLVAAVELEAWRIGIVSARRAPPPGLFTGVALLALVAASGFGGSFVARRAWEWRAFRGLQPERVERRFVVIGTSNGRSGPSLSLRELDDGRQVTMSCAGADLATVRPGDRVLLPVETGRGGVERVRLAGMRAASSTGD